jgi:hypothetical protein
VSYEFHVATLTDRRCQLPESWASIAERRAEFERSPNARWLWLTDEDVPRLLAYAELMTLARSKRLPFDMTALEASAWVARTQQPDRWTVLQDCERFMIDVPHAPPKPQKNNPMRVSKRPNIDSSRDLPTPALQQRLLQR